MRSIPEEMADRIESGAATLCHVWLLRRNDGLRMGFTDHDRDLTMDGLTCRAGSGWTAGAAEAGTGLAAGLAAASGGLDDESLNEVDIQGGLYDQARVELWRVDWTQPGLRVRLWTARIARLKRDGAAFEAELEGPMAALDRVVGRAYGRTCDAILGDTRCGVDLEGRPDQGCDKRWATCVGVFDNGVNFQGFPDIPGDDFLTAHPASAALNDGRSRR